MLQFDLCLFKNGTATCKNIILQQDTTYKISLTSIVSFIEDLCLDLNNSGSPESFFSREYQKFIDLHHHYFAAENIRDIYSGIIKELINDNHAPETQDCGSFGYLAGNTKPQRQEYIELCESINKFDYIETEKFDQNNKSFKTVLDFKKRYKYFIDLRGHSYSTKSLLFLASKRVFFTSEHPETTEWEKKYLKPWENYIPVNQDLSDLEKNYELIQSKPSLYEKIVENNNSLIKNELSNKVMMKNLVDFVSTKPNCK